MDLAIEDIWAKRNYFCFTFTKKELIDLFKFVNKAYSFIKDEDFKIGIISFSIIGAKLDDLLETSKPLTEESIQILQAVNFEEMMNFSLKSGEESKLSNTVIYMAHVFAIRCPVKDSEVLYKEFIDRFAGWLKGVGDMVEFLKNEKLSFECYKKIRVRDFGSKFIIWMGLKASKIFEKIEDEEFTEFYDLLAEHLWLSNDLNSLNKTNSEDISVYKRMEEFKEFSIFQIKDVLKARLGQIEKDMQNFSNVDQKIRIILIDCVKTSFTAHSEADRYKDLPK